MSEANFELFEPFDIDNGELDGLSQQECFVLGYELAQVHALLRGSCGFEKTVHAANINRVKASAARRERECKIVWASDDVSESWAYMIVETANGQSV